MKYFVITIKNHKFITSSIISSYESHDSNGDKILNRYGYKNYFNSISIACLFGLQN